jgi:DNA-binding LacI/PurR family transcriptional regulator
MPVGRGTVDGFVVIGLSEDHPEVEQIRRSGLPLVIVDGGALPEHGLVESNDEVGARSAARHLLGLGHREFVVMGIEPPAMPGQFEYSAGPTESVAGRRLTGYRQGLELGGVKVREERMVVGPATFDGGAAAFHRIWEDGLRPTAILAMSDAMAIGAMWAAREVGLRVPEDLSIVGFDDLNVSPHSNPPLTTVHQPIRQKGEEAARLLLANDRQSGHGATRAQDPRHALMIRGSTTAPPTHGHAPPTFATAAGPGASPATATATSTSTAPAEAPATAPAPPASDESRSALHSGPTAGPDWVRDAVFYQIFVDRFASSRASPSPVPWSAGTRRRPPTASRAATCSGSPSTWTSCASWASLRST